MQIKILVLLILAADVLVRPLTKIVNVSLKLVHFQDTFLYMLVKYS